MAAFADGRRCLSLRGRGVPAGTPRRASIWDSAAMARLSSLAMVALVLAALTSLLSTCTSFSGLAASGGNGATLQDRYDLLRGTWLREYTEDGAQVQRVLSLEPGGTFHESVHVVEAAGTVTDFRHEGTWLYDGTNLKRRYTLMNGKPPSRLNLPFATFEIAFDSRNAFTGIDHIHGHRIEYHRMAADDAGSPD
jgi:hypothetical protein